MNENSTFYARSYPSANHYHDNKNQDFKSIIYDYSSILVVIVRRG